MGTSAPHWPVSFSIREILLTHILRIITYHYPTYISIVGRTHFSCRFPIIYRIIIKLSLTLLNYNRKYLIPRLPFFATFFWNKYKNIYRFFKTTDFFAEVSSGNFKIHIQFVCSQLAAMYFVFRSKICRVHHEKQNNICMQTLFLHG